MAITTAAGDLENTDPDIIKYPLLKDENKNLEDAQTGTNDGEVSLTLGQIEVTPELDYPGQPGVGGPGAITEGKAIGPNLARDTWSDYSETEFENITIIGGVDSSPPIPNKLHSFASYTYGLSLALLSKEEYNKIVDNGEYTPNRVLIASAGRYENTQGPKQP